MWPFRRNTETIYDVAVKSKTTASKRMAKMLIAILDEEVKKNGAAGHTCAFIYPFRTGLNTNEEALLIMKEHYEKLGFVVEVEFESNIEMEKNRYKTFCVRW